MSAKVSAKQDGVLVTTIPYTKGWKVKVDGKEVSTEKSIQDLLVFSLDEGRHTIEMNYETPMLKAGMVASGLGVILLLELSWCIISESVEIKHNK